MLWLLVLFPPSASLTGWHTELSELIEAPLRWQQRPNVALCRSAVPCLVSRPSAESQLNWWTKQGCNNQDSSLKISDREILYFKPLAALLNPHTYLRLMGSLIGRRPIYLPQLEGIFLLIPTLNSKRRRWAHTAVSDPSRQRSLSIKKVLFLPKKKKKKIIRSCMR